MGEKKQNWRFTIFIPVIFLLLSQLIFIFLETIGWIPRLNDIGGNVIGFFTEEIPILKWFNFYETPQFNIATVIIGLTVIFRVMSRIFTPKV